MGALDVIETDAQTREALAYSFDFDVRRRHDCRMWFRLAPGWTATAIAQDAAGGIFAACEPASIGQHHVAYVSSEGQAGVVASGIDEWLGLLLELPYWFDLLKFSRGGSLEEMRRVVPHAEREMREDRPEAFQLAPQLFALLQLTRPEDPVRLLHRNVSERSQGLPIQAPDGVTLEPLFNRFSVQDNPMWRRGLREPREGGPTTGCS